MIKKDNTQKKYKYVLFDFDGTVVDTIPLIMETFKYVFITLTGKEADNDYLLSTIGEPLEKTFSILDISQQNMALEHYFEYNKTRLKYGVGIFNGMFQTIKQIKSQGGITGLVTAKRFSSAIITIKQFELEELFDVIITRESTKRHKPLPDPIFEGLRQIKNKFPELENISTDQTIYIGDSIHDLKSAKAAKVAAGIVDWTYMNKKILRECDPEHWIYSPQEIIELCEG